MKRATISFIAFILAGGAAAQAYAHGHKHADVPRVIIRFGTMYGVDGPFLGDSNKIRGIPGDDLPWEVERVDGFLLTDGRLKIAVRGLVFKDDPSVPPELVGINDADEFRAIVSCLTEDSETKVGRANIFSKGVPSDPQRGNAFIDTRIDLPDTCVAPIVFIAPGDERDWFAVTGNEIEEEE